jgi:hypothetical protein
MRKVLRSVCLLALVPLAGCDNWGILRGSSTQQQALPPGGAPNAAILVTYLNQNAQRVQSLSSNEVEMDCTVGSQSIGLNGQMACDKPRGFRMTAKSPIVGKVEFDLGSNDREFWYWIARAQPPYQFFCSYEDLNTKQIPLPFPFQPEWVIEALGMGTYATNGQYRVESKGDTYELIQDTVSQQGQPVRKVIVFNKTQKNGVIVRAYVLRDASNKEICSAEIRKVQKVGERGTEAWVPYDIVLNWAASKETMKLAMKLDKVKVNQVSPDQARSLFVRQPMSNIQPFDLASLANRNDPRGGVQQTGGVLR